MSSSTTSVETYQSSKKDNAQTGKEPNRIRVEQMIMIDHNSRLLWPGPVIRKALTQLDVETAIGLIPNGDRLIDYCWTLSSQCQNAA
jgi:hypothetical protein